MNGLDLQSQKIVSLADPSANTDAANKQYVDNVARGLQWKNPVRAASTADVTVASPGATLDGVALAVNDRVLLKNQTTAAENGIYVWTAPGSPLSRAADADANGELAPGTSVSVAEGTVNTDKVFMIISDAAITIGTTAQSWGQLGGGSGGGGSGDVVGPASSTDNFLPRFDGTTGRLLQGSLLAVDDSGNLGLGTAPTGPGTYNTVTVGGVSSAKHGQVIVRGNTGQVQAYLYGGNYANQPIW